MIPWIHLKQLMHMALVYVALVCVRSADTASLVDGRGPKKNSLNLNLNGP